MLSSGLTIERGNSISRPLYTREVAQAVRRQGFLRQRGYEALLQLALGSVDIESFRVRARAEQETRTRASAALQQREAADLRLRDEETKRKNTPLFAEQERKAELRSIRNRFGQPFIEKQHYRKVMGILRSVDSGAPIGKAEQLFFAGEGETTGHRSYAKPTTKFSRNNQPLVGKIPRMFGRQSTHVVIGARQEFPITDYE